MNNTHPNLDTVVFQNPITGRIEQMPVAMVRAYVETHMDFYTGLDLQKAAEVAAIRDDEAAQNLLLSVVEVQSPEVLGAFEALASVVR